MGNVFGTCEQVNVIYVNYALSTVSVIIYACVVHCSKIRRMVER